MFPSVQSMSSQRSSFDHKGFILYASYYFSKNMFSDYYQMSVKNLILRWVYFSVSYYFSTNTLGHQYQQPVKELDFVIRDYFSTHHMYQTFSQQYRHPIEELHFMMTVYFCTCHIIFQYQYCLYSVLAIAY